MTKFFSPHCIIHNDIKRMLYFHRTILTTNEENMYCYTRKYRIPWNMVLQLWERQLTKKHSM